MSNREIKETKSKGKIKKNEKKNGRKRENKGKNKKERKKRKIKQKMEKGDILEKRTGSERERNRKKRGVERETFSLRSTEIGPSVFLGARSKVDPRNEGYA